MAVTTREFHYDVDGDTFAGLLAWDDARAGPLPGVMVCHAWGGRSDFEDDKARALAELGYVGFAADVYGKGRRGTTRDENAALLNEMLDDRERLQRRLLGSLDAMAEQAGVDAAQRAAIGFCFGGLCVLDIARTGADVAGVASFHGLFAPAPNIEAPKVSTRVLALHGWDDPMATPDSVLGFATEMTKAGADWQLHAYGSTMHAFTNPAAADPDFGTVYDAAADRRSWQALRGFLAELFAD